MTAEHLEHTIRVGIPIVDEQHDGLLAIHDEIADSVRTERPPYHTIELMARLYQQSRMHFETEEAIMEQLGYPDLERHRAEHESLTARLRAIVLEYRRSGDAVTVEMVDFLRKWVVEHIGGEDQRLADYARRHPEAGVLG